MLEVASHVSVPRQPIVRSPIQTSSIYKEIISECEVKRPKTISVLDMANKRCIPHRRLYDLFNLLTGLEIARNEQRGQIVWEGLGMMAKHIEEAYVAIEHRSMKEDLTSIFKAQDSSSLGDLATNFICLYMFLDVRILQIRQVVSLFRSMYTPAKTLERRLYLVLNILEVLGWVEHVNRTGEYRQCVDLTDIIQNALNQKFERTQQQNPHSYLYLLNKPPPTIRNRDVGSRRLEYSKYALV